MCIRDRYVEADDVAVLAHRHRIRPRQVGRCVISELPDADALHLDPVFVATMWSHFSGPYEVPSTISVFVPVTRPERRSKSITRLRSSTSRTRIQASASGSPAVVKIVCTSGMPAAV